MKSIDEVIKAVHHCGLLTGFDDTYEYDGGCPYEDCLKCEQKRVLGKDIIYYLEKYRDSQKMTRTERLIDVLREVRGEK